MKFMHMCPCSNMCLCFDNFQWVLWCAFNLLVLSGYKTKLQFWFYFLSYFPLYYHTFKPCIPQIQNSVPYNLREIESLELIMKLCSKEMQKYMGISVQMHKPQYMLSLVRRTHCAFSGHFWFEPLLLHFSIMQSNICFVQCLGSFWC